MPHLGVRLPRSRGARAVEYVWSSPVLGGCALGDSNFDGFRLPGLTSAWEGREGAPGTLGPRRKVDDVHLVHGQASSVTLLTSDSDHKAVIVDHVRP